VNARRDFILNEHAAFLVSLKVYADFSIAYEWRLDDARPQQFAADVDGHVSAR